MTDSKAFDGSTRIGKQNKQLFGVKRLVVLEKFKPRSRLLRTETTQRFLLHPRTAIAQILLNGVAAEKLR